jgi:two-component system, sensor histidine kinase and response regulator
VPQEHKVYLPPGGKMDELIRSHDWSTTPLGPFEQWPQSLHAIVKTILGSPFPMILGWGPELTAIYNDAYLPLLGKKHTALGKPFLEIWNEATDIISPLIGKALAGESLFFRDAAFTLMRHGYPEQTSFDYSYSPLQDDNGAVAGFLNIAVETTECKRAEEALRESESRYRTLFERTVNPILVIDYKGNYIDANKAALRFLECSRDELLAMNVMDTIPPSKEKMLEEHLPLWETGGILETDYFVKGRVKTMILTITPGTWLGLPVVFGNGTDITERKRAEDKLLESEERNRLVKLSTNDVIWDWNLKTNEETWEGNVTNAFGLSPEDLGPTAQGWYDRIHPDDHERVSEKIHAAIEGGDEFWTDEYRFRCADGRWKDFLDRAYILRDAAGVAYRMIGSMQDITTRKRAEEELRKTSSELSNRTLELNAILTSVKDYLYIFDSQGRFVFVNEMLLNLWGLSKEQSFGKTMHELNYPESVEKTLTLAYEHVFRTKHSTTNETQYVSPTGTTGIFENILAPIIGSDGQVEYVVGSSRDITHRKRAEEALLESEQRFRTMADKFPLIIWVHDTEGSQRFVNRTFYEFFGLSPEELTPEKWASLMDPETATAYANEFLSCVREQRPFHGEVQVKRADGQWRWLESWGRPQYSASGEYSAFVGTSADITDRKKAEDALRESESFYRQTLESIPGMVFTTRPDGYCDYQSQQWVEYTGIPISEHLGNGWNNLLHPEDRSRVYAAWRDAVEERAPYDVEYRVRRRDGEYEWFKVVGRPIRDKEDRIVRWFGVALNIDLFKRTEEALRQSINEVKLREREARERGRILDAMMDYIPMGITIADAPDVTIRRVSRYGKQLIGRSSEQIEGIAVDKHVDQWDIYHADGFTRASNEELPLTRATQKGEQVRDELWVLGHHDGKKIPILCNAAPIRDEHGDIVGGVIGWQDITELLNQREKLQNLASQLENRIRERTFELEQANRAKDEFLANMSHEIRTPMSGVLGLTEILLHQDLPETMQEDLAMIRTSAESVMILINDLFDLSRISQGKFVFHPTDFELRSMLRDAIRPFEFQAMSWDLEFVLVLDESLPSRVRIDRDRLGQVIKNLVSNAIKFTEQGYVRIEARAEEENETTSRLIFSVSDSGIGIPVDKQEDVFSAFTQLDPSYSKKFAGMGLGLAISKSLVEGMGGEIRVQSEKGRGSTFTFSVQCEVVADTAQPSPPSLSLNDLQPMKILLAEDNPVNRLFLRRALITAGHAVFEVENGVQALEMLAKDRFDIILMDIQMPVMDGVEATRRIRSGKHGRPDIPIIALTAYAMKGDREKFLDNGMDGYVTKPVDFGELAKTIAEVCGLPTKTSN